MKWLPTPMSRHVSAVFVALCLMILVAGVTAEQKLGLLALAIIATVTLLLYTRTSATAHRETSAPRQVSAPAEAQPLPTSERADAARTAQIKDLALHLQKAREDERSRLARDLHDELGALLTSAKLDAARIKARLGNTAPEAQERLAHLVSTLNSSIALGRRIIEDLRPSTLANLGLVTTLEILTREFAEQSGLTVHCTLAQVRLAPAAELVVYRIVQEALTNITKYAGARNVWLALGQHNGNVHVRVRDDGVGFDAQLRKQPGYGLMGMRFRVEAEGGTLDVASTPDVGTLIHAVLPGTSVVVA